MPDQDPQELPQCLCAEHWPGKGHPADCPVGQALRRAAAPCQGCAERDARIARLEGELRVENYKIALLAKDQERRKARISELEARVMALQDELAAK